MKKIIKQFKPVDFIIIIACVLLSFVPLGIFAAQEYNKVGEPGKVAVIKINGKEVDRFEIYKIDHKEKKYVPAKGQYNILEIEKGRIRDREDNSPDQIAVRTGWISEVGETAICLPHKLVIEIISTGKEKVDESDGYQIY